MASKKSAQDSILDALRMLLEKHSFSSIKVTDIIKHAQVSHQTFYRLFSDKYALAEYMCNSDVNLFSLVYGSNAMWKEIMICWLNVIKNRRKTYANLLTDPQGINIISGISVKVSTNLTGTSLSTGLQAALERILRQWAENRFEDSIEDVYSRVLHSIPICELMSDAEMEAIIRRYEQKTLSDFRNQNR